jgi:hypothetical protein
MTDRIFVYNYDKHDNFYIGDSIARLDPIEGKPMLPACSTFLEPPSKAIDDDEIAVFDVDRNQWVMQPNDFWRPHETRRLIRLRHTLTGDLSITQISPFRHFKYRGIPRVIAPVTISMSLSGRLHYLNIRAKEISDMYAQRMNGYSIEQFHYMKILSEDLVIQIKRFIDDIFINEWLELERESSEFQKSKIVRIQSVNEVSRLPAGKTRDYLQSMKDEDPDFFEIITDLRNSFAHHLTVAESYCLIGLDYPTINTIYMKKGDLNTMELIEVYVEDITRSFNDFIKRTFTL